MPGINTTGQPNTSDYFLGRGAVYLSSLHPTTKKPTVWRHLGNSPEFNLTAEVETLEHQSSRGGLKITDLEVVVSQKVSLALTLDELNFQNLSLFLSGSTVDDVANPANSSIGSNGAEVILIDFSGTDPDAGVTLGRWVDLHDGSFNRVYDIEDANDVNLEDHTGTPLVEGTDYTVDTVMGRIFLLATAVNIEDGDGLQWYLDAPLGGRATVDEVRALTQTSVTAALKFISENPASSSHQTEYHFHQVKLKAEGDLSLIGEEITTLQLTGVAERNELADADAPVLRVRTHANAMAV